MPQRSSKRPTTPSRVQLEWVGGRARSPFRVADDGRALDLLIWVDRTNSNVIGTEVVDPDAPTEAEVEYLLRLVAEAGDPGPQRILVSNPELAKQIDGVLSAVVRVGDTPEVSAVAKAIESDARRTSPSYLVPGDLAPLVVGELFAAASLFRGARPWTRFSSKDVLEIAVPDLCTHPFSVAVIGGGRGLLIFESFRSYLRMLAATSEPRDSATRHAGVRFSALRFFAHDEVPASMRREARDHAWQVPESASYPVVSIHDHDGCVAVATEWDYRMVTAVAEAVARITSDNAQAPAGACDRSYPLQHAGTKLEARVVFPHPGWDSCWQG